MKAKNRIFTGLVNVSILSNTRDSQSDTRLAWIMYHNIYAIYREMKHHETLQESIEIQNLKSSEYFSPFQLYQPTELRLPVEIQVFPTELQDT